MAARVTRRLATLKLIAMLCFICCIVTGNAKTTRTATVWTTIAEAADGDNDEDETTSVTSTVKPDEDSARWYYIVPGVIIGCIIVVGVVAIIIVKCCESTSSTDITFVIDNSRSIRDKNVGEVDNWNLMLDFIIAIVRQLNISPETTRVAAVDFGIHGHLDFNLGDYPNTNDVIDAIRRIGYREGRETNLAGGLRVCNEKQLSFVARMQVYAANDRHNADRVIVVITDGVPTVDQDQLAGEVGRIKASGIKIIAIGVTNQVDETLLRDMVTRPSCRNYFHVSDFNGLDHVVERLSVRTYN